MQLEHRAELWATWRSIASERTAGIASTSTSPVRFLAERQGLRRRAALGVSEVDAEIDPAPAAGIAIDDVDVVRGPVRIQAKQKGNAAREHPHIRAKTCWRLAAWLAVTGDELPWQRDATPRGIISHLTAAALHDLGTIIPGPPMGHCVDARRSRRRSPARDSWTITMCGTPTRRAWREVTIARARSPATGTVGSAPRSEAADFQKRFQTTRGSAVRTARGEEEAEGVRGEERGWRNRFLLLEASRLAFGGALPRRASTSLPRGVQSRYRRHAATKTFSILRESLSCDPLEPKDAPEEARECLLTPGIRSLNGRAAEPAFKETRTEGHRLGRVRRALGTPRSGWVSVHGELAGGRYQANAPMTKIRMTTKPTTAQIVQKMFTEMPFGFVGQRVTTMKPAEDPDIAPGAWIGS